MKFYFPLFVGLRYTRAKRRNQFLSFISMISLLGMMLGVVALIVVLSVMNGFEAELRGRVLSLLPHAIIEFSDNGRQDWQDIVHQIKGKPGITGVAPTISGEAMLAVPGMVRGIQLNAILPSAEAQVSVIGERIIAGSLGDLRSREYGIVLGTLLARHLGLTLGDAVTLVIPKVSVTPAGIFPRSRKFTVVGVFEVGAQMDSNTAFIHLEDGQRLFALKDRVQGLRVQTTDLYRVASILAPLKNSLPADARISDWSHSQGSLFQAVKMEKTMIAVLLMTVVAVAAFNIISILTMMVTEKRPDIAVLRTMGASAQSIMAIFVVQGLSIGFFGVLLGGAAGVFLALNIGDVVAAFENVFHVYVFDPSVYFITEIPSVLEWQDVTRIVCGSLALSFLATLYPAYSAARISPAEALRYDK